jgi:hypothetical protein
MSAKQESLQQQAEAWEHVFDALSEVRPNWISGDECGQDKAVAEIRRLARSETELLEALQQCFDYPADVFSIGDNEPFTMTVTGRHLRLVRAAIQKATAGENE